MPYIYESRCHLKPYSFEFETIKEAIRAAAVDLELGEAWPGKIIAPDNSVIWVQSGPFTTADTLQKLAEKHGVAWPDV